MRFSNNVIMIPETEEEAARGLTIFDSIPRGVSMLFDLRHNESRLFTGRGMKFPLLLTLIDDEPFDQIVLMPGEEVILPDRTKFVIEEVK